MLRLDSKVVTLPGEASPKVFYFEKEVGSHSDYKSAPHTVKWLGLVKTTDKGTMLSSKCPFLF